MPPVASLQYNLSNAFRHLRGPLSAVLATTIGLGSFTPVFAQYVVNAGETVILETLAGTPHTINDSSITINGLVRIYEINGVGTRTGNGGYLILNSTGGLTVGSAGSINANAYASGGNGGVITLNGTLLTINGGLTANGLGAGRGGIINMIGNTINVNSMAVIQARAGSATSYGGEIDMDSTGVITLANGSVLSTSGLSNGTSNLIEITGTGVNLNGLVNATGLGSGDGGTITVIATTNGVVIGNTSQLLAYSSNGGGGAINLDGDVTVEGSVQAHSAANGQTGGVITITGTSGESLAVQNGGILYVNGRTGYAGSAGHAGTIDVDTGSVNLANGYVKAEGGWTGGNAGTIDIRSTNGSITVGNGMQVLATGDNNGTILLSATGGALNLNAGGSVKAQTNQNSVLTLSSNGGVTIAGLAEAGGWQNNHGGTLNINSLSNTDVTISSGGIASARGGQTGVTNGGNINISSARDVFLTGATSGANTDRPNDAHIRVYGNESGGTLGQGGVITINAGDDFVANEFVTVNANGTTVPSGATYTKGVIDLNITDTATIDGIFQVGGRASGHGGGGLIDISAGNDITVDSTSVLEASVSNFLGTATGDGGRIDITSTNGDITVNGGSTVIGGVTRGLIDFSSGTTGDGGQLNVTANNGNVTFTNANLVGTGADFGGIVNLIAGNTLNVNALSTVSTTGLADATRNRIDVQGNNLSINGVLNANATSGGGGYIKITDGNSTINGSTSGTLNVAGATQGGTIHLVGTSVNTASAQNYGDAAVILEGTSGNVVVDQTITSRSLTMNSTGGTVTGNANFSNAGTLHGSGNTMTITGTSGDMTVGTLTSPGNITATTNSGNMVLASGESVTSSGALDLTASGTLTNSGSDLSASSGIGLTSTGGSINGIGGSYTGTVTGTANNGAFSLTSDSGNLTVQSIDAESITLNVNSGSYLQTATGLLRTVNGNDGGDVSIYASNNISFQGAGSGGTTINTSANSSNGGLGGSVRLSSNQDIILNGDINTQGYVRSNNQNGSGGNFTASAGGAYTQNSGARLLLSSNSLSTNTNNATGNGGNVSVTANSITFNNSSGNDSILSTGYDTTRRNNDGGDGGSVLFDSATFIDMNDGGTNGYYFNITGGDGTGRRGDGGDGGNVNLNYGTTLSIERINRSADGSGNFWREGGAGGSNGGVDGADGTLHFNGVLQ